MPYARLDGSMPLAKRQRALEDFTRKPNVRVMLLSLKAGGLGLTLTAANVRGSDDSWCTHRNSLGHSHFLLVN